MKLLKKQLDWYHNVNTINKKTSILVQGITGSEGLFHAQQMLDYGSNVVCGVTPGKGGQTATENNLQFLIASKKQKRVFN